jgi:hypothetical protein
MDPFASNRTLAQLAWQAVGFDELSPRYTGSHDRNTIVPAMVKRDDGSSSNLGGTAESSFVPFRDEAFLFIKGG